jgi:2-desacetyl-2-hydroxyethyl bacteriochlorophyllide A dehydrogenase
LAEAFWWTGPLEGELREAVLPSLAEGDVRVRTLFSGVSRGTERLVASGRVPESEWNRMRCPFQEGDLPFPVKYGYSAVGEVEAGPAELVGRPVFALYPHQSAFVLPATSVMPLPDGVPPGRAVLAPNMETALNAVWDGGIGPGDRVVVIGAGVVGCLVAWIASRMPGTEVTLTDLDPSRREIAEQLGTGFAGPGALPAEADVVVEASGAASALAGAIPLAGFEATLLVVGWYGSEPVSLPLGGAFHSRRLRLVSSQVGQVAATRRPRWQHRRRLAKALELLAKPELDFLIEGEVAFADLPTAMRRILAGTGLCQRITYQHSGRSERCTR